MTWIVRIASKNPRTSREVGLQTYVLGTIRLRHHYCTSVFVHPLLCLPGHTIGPHRVRHPGLVALRICTDKNKILVCYFTKAGGGWDDPRSGGWVDRPYIVTQNATVAACVCRFVRLVCVFCLRLKIRSLRRSLSSVHFMRDIIRLLSGCISHRHLRRFGIMIIFDSGPFGAPRRRILRTPVAALIISVCIAAACLPIIACLLPATVAITTLPLRVFVAPFLPVIQIMLRPTRRPSKPRSFPLSLSAFPVLESFRAASAFVGRHSPEWIMASSLGRMLRQVPQMKKQSLFHGMQDMLMSFIPAFQLIEKGPRIVRWLHHGL